MIHCEIWLILHFSVFPSPNKFSWQRWRTFWERFSADGCRPLAQADVLFFMISYSIRCTSHLDVKLSYTHRVSKKHLDTSRNIQYVDVMDGGWCHKGIRSSLWVNVDLMSREIIIMMWNCRSYFSMLHLERLDEADHTWRCFYLDCMCFVLDCGWTVIIVLAHWGMHSSNVTWKIWSFSIFVRSLYMLFIFTWW